MTFRITRTDHPQVFGVAQPPLNLTGMTEHLQTLGGCSASPRGGSKTTLSIFLFYYFLL
jgi:hypothetical protein